jgi:biopolymer transport protein ExbB/TolQ
MLFASRAIAAYLFTTGGYPIMFEGKSLWQIFHIGGFTMYILLFCSVWSFGVIINRLIDYAAKSRVKRARFMERIRKDIEAKNVNGAIEVCRKTYSPLANVVLSGLKLYGHEEKAISNAMEREITIEIIKLERYTSIIGTIGNIAVYIGLFGTVLGIIRAFHDISAVGQGGMNVVIGGVSEALITTATGLGVAIPAVVVYNYCVKRIDNFTNDMELCASELIDLIESK